MKIHLAIVLTAMALLTGCVSKEVPVIQKYIDTEIRSEPYQVTEQYEIKTPHITSLYTIDESELARFKLLQFNVPYPVHILLNKVGGGTVKWAIVGRRGYDLLRIYQFTVNDQDTNARVSIKFDNNESKSLCIQSISRENRAVQNGFQPLVGSAIESRLAGYHALQSSSTLFDDMLRDQWSTGYTDTRSQTCTSELKPEEIANPIEFSIDKLFKVEDWALISIRSPASVSYVWDSVQEGTRQVTKYRDIPYQVEKQRTVIVTKSVPFWETDSSK